MNNVLKALLAVAILLIGIGVFYRFVIYLPGVDADVRTNYKQCKADVSANFNAAWADACRVNTAYGFHFDPQRDSNCELPPNVGQQLNASLNANLQRCFSEAQSRL